MDLPKVSCYCATYGRTWALEEAVESFLRQDYEGEKELVILNDCHLHTLVCDDPEVMVYNTPVQIKPLGKKFNETVSLCTGDILFPWEDDDVYLENKLSYTVAHMKNGFFHTNLAFMEKHNQQELEVAGNYFHCNMAVSRALWNRAGKYLEIDKCDLDINFLSRMKEAAQFTGHEVPIDEIFYVYRWGSVQSYHASGWGSADGVRASDGAAQIIASQARDGLVPRGEYVLRPHWKYDYAAAAERAVKAYQEGR